MCGEGDREFSIFFTIIKLLEHDFSYPTRLFSGVEEYVPKALSHLEICLGTKPLADSMFRVTTPGLYNGMLLITGSRGSGKSSLAKALCRRMAEKENLARIFPVDCKPLRGRCYFID